MPPILVSASPIYSSGRFKWHTTFIPLYHTSAKRIKKRSQRAIQMAYHFHTTYHTSAKRIKKSTNTSMKPGDVEHCAAALAPAAAAAPAAPAPASTSRDMPAIRWGGRLQGGRGRGGGARGDEAAHLAQTLDLGAVLGRERPVPIVGLGNVSHRKIGLQLLHDVHRHYIRLQHKGHVPGRTKRGGARVSSGGGRGRLGLLPGALENGRVSQPLASTNPLRLAAGTRLAAFAAALHP